MQPFPYPSDATHKIWSRLTNWLQRYSSSKVWNFRHSRASNSKMSGLIWPKFELVLDFMHVLVTASIKRIGSKATEKRWRHHFSHYKSMGAFCCHGHQSFDPICFKTLCSLSPPPVMLHIKSNQDWPTGLRDIQIRKCKIFVIQGQITPKWVVWSGQKSNSSQLLCLSWIPATLMMIR